MLLSVDTMDRRFTLDGVRGELCTSLSVEDGSALFHSRDVPFEKYGLMRAKWSADSAAWAAKAPASHTRPINASTSG
jgi:hypothetical protein